MEEIIKKIDEYNFSENELNIIISECKNIKKKNRVEMIKNKLLFEHEIKDVNTINLIKKIIDFDFEFENNVNYSDNTLRFKILLGDDDTYIFECYRCETTFEETNTYYSIEKKTLNSVEKILIFNSEMDESKKIKSSQNTENLFSTTLDRQERY